MNRKTHHNEPDAAADLLQKFNGQRFPAFLADPPSQFQNRTGKVAPEHRRLSRYGTMKLQDIMALPVRRLAGKRRISTSGSRTRSSPRASR